MAKDLRRAQQVAEFVDAITPMGIKACILYKNFAENSGTDKDFSAILNAFASKKQHIY